MLAGNSTPIIQLVVVAPTDIAARSHNIGVGAAVLSVAIPIAIYFLAMNRWKPTSRVQYAARFALWPLVVVSSALGGPIARAVAGHTSRYSMSIEQAVPAALFLAAVLGLIFFGIGYAISGRRFEKA